MIGQHRRTCGDGRGRRGDTATGFSFTFARLLLLLLLDGRSPPQLAVLGSSVLKPNFDLSLGQADVGRDGGFALRCDVRSSFVFRLQFHPLSLRVDRPVLVARPRLACHNDKHDCPQSNLGTGRVAIRRARSFRDVFARWRQRARLSNTRFLEPTPLNVPNGSSIGSAVLHGREAFRCTLLRCPISSQI